MGKYCCFCCPAHDYADKSLDDQCPTCMRVYGFPLVEQPATIGEYRIIQKLGRGFYAATYVAERGALNARAVLKVSPKSFYEYFENKNFREECQRHAEVAQGTEHIVGIRDMFEANVVFGATELPCNVAELEYIDGKLLADHLQSDIALSAPSVAQIAIDLFRIRDELLRKGVNHNDLHAENIIVEVLGSDARRAQAIDDSMRAVAIDLGSIAEASRSDSRDLRLGDLHWIGNHLSNLVAKLLKDPDGISDLDNRLATALQLIVQSISPGAEFQRTPDSADFVQQIEEAYYRVTQHWKPWREALTLRAFGASYNAQTMHAWHVPHLLVDPDDQWLSAMCSPGPQVITGMRGCGKTMLLRALQFHARAAQRDSETNVDILGRLRSDGYVGLFVSAQRLLDQLGRKSSSAGDPFARLFVAYGLEAVRAIHHLRDIDESLVSDVSYKYLAEAIGDCLDMRDEMETATTAYDLENRLNRLLIALSRGSQEYVLTVHPNVAFPTLDGAVRRCSPIWQSSQVFFLLDDVSTRYLNYDEIEQLLSALLFQNSTCAFKLTSEAQTIELGLKSPGEIHPARVGRDLSIFDLGAEVYEKIKKQGRGNGRDFVERILQQRARHFAGHPSVTPSVLLGDVPLEVIASEIGYSRSNSATRKGVYRGLTALARMCVGDIGDVISLYEQILRKAAGQEAPIGQNVQSECFQDFCARRLYDLNRRGGFLKDVAKSFAEASNELLVKSCIEAGDAEGKTRIRQYSSLYVRVTTGDIESQTDRLRELIDAGVFVFAGGSNVPRTKTRDSNPTQQFKLTYRKIYGLVNFIGLAERDRFELSGSDLEEWLAEPSRGKEILLRNLGGDCAEGNDNGGRIQDKSEGDSAGEHEGDKREGEIEQFVLFQTGQVVPSTQEKEMPTVLLPNEGIFSINEKMSFNDVSEGAVPEISVEQIVVGLGFETRTLESVRRLSRLTNIGGAVSVEYEERGKGKEIEDVLSSMASECTSLTYHQVIQSGFPELDGTVLVDITGLAKPVIFHVIRNELRRKGRVWICYTEAEEHYPLDSDLNSILAAEAEMDRHTLLEEVDGVLTGEEGPYVADNLLSSDSDETRQRILCAASSPKHERLLSLMDLRDYDRVEIIAPKSNSARSMVAQIAADVAARNVANANVTQIDSNDLSGMLRFVSEHI